MSAAHLPVIVVGKMGESQMLEGWHERERDGRNGIPYRASRRDSTIVLRRDFRMRRLGILLSGPVALHGEPMDGRVVINRRKYELPLGVDAWVIRSFPIETRREILKIHIILEHPIVPDAILNNGDARELGWYISAVWQE